MNLPSSSSNPQSNENALADARRRGLLYAGVAAAAASSGAGWAWWKFRPHDVAQGAAEALWGQSFQTPDGAALAMQSFEGKPLLLNFWATWCPPCVEEMPLLDSFYRENKSKSWQVLGVAVDQPSAVRRFMQKTPVSYPIGMAGMGGTELSKSLGNLAGGLPFTVVVHPNGNVMHRKIGQVTPQNLAEWVGGI